MLTIDTANAAWESPCSIYGQNAFQVNLIWLTKVLFPKNVQYDLTERLER